MLCVLGLLVLAILALFSARYRSLAREALACVFRRVTLRKCTTGLDHRLKTMITGRLTSSTLTWSADTDSARARSASPPA